MHIGGRGISHKFLLFGFIAETEAFRCIHMDRTHKSLIYSTTHEKSQIFTANLPIFSFVPQFYLVKFYYSESYYGHVPLCTTLGLITHKLMDLNFSKNKSDLTGLCRKMNNFDFKFLKNVKKIRVF